MFFDTVCHKNFTMSGAATEYLSPNDVAKFCAAILNAGLRLGTLVTADYPKASLVSEALYVVTKIVGDCGLEGNWVTLWSSAAQIEFVATSEIQKVSASVSLFDTACMFLCHLLRNLFRLLYWR